MLATALHFSHQLLSEIVKPGDHVVDATMGNGHDTLFLAQLVGDSGKVYAFDVQEQALVSTAQRLEEANCQKQVILIHQGHETIDEVLTPDEPLRAAIFNLGYLPRGNKEIITQSPTTLRALESLLAHLVPKGRVLLVVYYGHEGGILERDAVLNYCQNLSQEYFNVLTYQFINQKNNPPLLVCIEKK